VAKSIPLLAIPLLPPIFNPIFPPIPPEFEHPKPEVKEFALVLGF
jgi:hypothetical protein